MELHLTLFTALSWWLFTLNGSWVHSTQNRLSLSPNLCPRNDNLDFEGPKINNFTFIFHLQLLCLCSEWDLLVFCVRGKKSGKLGWVENAKWLPLTIIPPLSLPAITYTLVVDLLFTLRQANWHAISSLPWSPTRIPSQQQLKKKSCGKDHLQVPKHRIWVISLHHMARSYQLGKLFSMSKGKGRNHMGSLKHRGSMFWV